MHIRSDAHGYDGELGLDVVITMKLTTPYQLPVKISKGIAH